MAIKGNEDSGVVLLANVCRRGGVGRSMVVSRWWLGWCLMVVMAFSVLVMEVVAVLAACL